MKRNAKQHNAIPRNPFRYGTVVDDPFFINRVKERDEIISSLLSGQHLIVYSPRRYGKTSLIKKVLKDLSKENYHYLFIDFFKIHSREKFIEEYARQVFANYTSWEKAFKRISSIVKSVKPVLTVGDQGIPELSVKFQKELWNTALDEILNLPEKLAEDTRWIVVFDEFQEIERLNGESFEKELRASLQHHKHVSYVFMGSRKHLITNIFTRKNRAFYNFGRLFKLEKLPQEELAQYIQDGFSKSGAGIETEVIHELMETAGNIPFYVQMLASILWDKAGKTDKQVTREDFDSTLETALWHQSDYYLAMIQELTAYQQKVLQVIAGDNTGIFTTEFTQKHGLSAISSTQKAVQRLEEKDILSKSGSSWHFEDPLFRLWLLRNC